MTTTLAEAQKQNQDIGIVLSNSTSLHILIELKLGLALKRTVKQLFVLTKNNMLDLLRLWRQIDNRLSVNHRRLRAAE